MQQPEARASGWQGVCLIAITYIYFLIFAQFAFLQRLAVLGIADQHLKAVMAAMALGGILFSLLTPRLKQFPSPQLRLRLALGACALAGICSLLQLSLPTAAAVALLIGCGLGLLTVTLVTWLKLWLGDRNPLLKVGLGTGLGYLFCNFPPFFTASPQVQALIPAALCVAGLFITFQRVEVSPGAHPATPEFPVSFIRVLACFTALVWLDSAAFFIIQNTPSLKAGTWEGSVHLWINGFLHLLAALASAWWLRRRGLSFVLSLAFIALATACLLLLDPNRALLASAFYPAGVSLYSVALVAYPSLLAPASSPEERGRQAGWIYAIAGWFGSAMGIGMGQNLGHVPPAFVLLAGIAILAPLVTRLLRRRRRELVSGAAVLAAALGIDRLTLYSHPQPSASERGRAVYVAEGCINCHSQYVRPDTADTLMWGPAQPLSQIRDQQPPLIGNRRQGPDLAAVGNRRSKLWFKAHLYAPSQLSSDSFMPSYAYLFLDSRGDDLVSYLQTLKTHDPKDHLLEIQAWSGSHASGNPEEGESLFLSHCATCHSNAGSVRNKWYTSFRRLPPNLRTGPFAHLDPAAPVAPQVARIVKFGIPGTDMPGHEYLPDRQIASLSLWVDQGIAKKTP